MTSPSELLRRAIHGIPEIVVPVLLTKEGSGKASTSGTAVIARAGQQFFAVTAAHVVWGTGAPPRLSGPRNAVSLNQVIRVKDPANHDAQIDVAYAALSERHIELLEPAAAIDLTLVVPDLVCEPEDVYFAVGYPTSKSKYRASTRDLTVQRYHLALNGVPDAEYARLGLSRDTHLVLRYARNEGRNADESSVVGPHPLGMSGGLVLRPRIDSSQPSGIGYDPVSILISYRPADDLLISTRLIYVMASMRGRFPETDALLPTSRRIDLQLRQP